MIKKEFDALSKIYDKAHAQLYQRMQEDLRLYLSKFEERRSLMFRRFLCWLGFHIYIVTRTITKTTKLSGDGGTCVTESETLLVRCLRERCNYKKEG